MKFKLWVEEQTPVIKNAIEKQDGIELRFTNPSLDAPLIGISPTKDMNQWQIKTSKGTFLANMDGKIGRPLYEKWRKTKGWTTPVPYHDLYGKGWAKHITPNTMTIYRGIAGEFMPYSEKAAAERDKWHSYLNNNFSDNQAKIKWLKSNPDYYKKVIALDAMDRMQNATPNLESAINYALQTSKRSGISPPLVIAITVPSKELPEPVGSIGNEIFDLSAEEFTNFFNKYQGKILSIPQALLPGVRYSLNNN